MIRTSLQSEINWEFDLKDYKQALECYENNMSKGKVILKPNLIEEELKSKL